MSPVAVCDGPIPAVLIKLVFVFLHFGLCGLKNMLVSELYRWCMLNVACEDHDVMHALVSPSQTEMHPQTLALNYRELYEEELLKPAFPLCQTPFFFFFVVFFFSR